MVFLCVLFPVTLTFSQGKEKATSKRNPHLLRPNLRVSHCLLSKYCFPFALPMVTGTNRHLSDLPRDQLTDINLCCATQSHNARTTSVAHQTARANRQNRGKRKSGGLEGCLRFCCFVSNSPGHVAFGTACALPQRTLKVCSGSSAPGHLGKGTLLALSLQPLAQVVVIELCGICHNQRDKFGTLPSFRMNLSSFSITFLGRQNRFSHFHKA